jgi:hypothetical protein
MLTTLLKQPRWSFPMYPHDPAALAYQQWLQQQQQPAPQYTQPRAAFPFAFPAGAQQQLAAATPQYMPPPLAPLSMPQYMPPPPAFQPSQLFSPVQRRPRQPRQPPLSEPAGNELVSLFIVLLSLVVGAAFGAVGEHHRLSTTVEAGVVP